MAFHNGLHQTGYELAAINSETGERIFIAHVRGGKSRRIVQNTLLRELDSPTDRRIDRISKLVGCEPESWMWSKKAVDGCVSGSWSIRFTGRTGLQVDQEGQGRSIYQ